LPASASPAEAHREAVRSGCTIEKQRTVGSVLTVCLTRGDNRKNVRGPYGFEISESCQTCKLSANGFYCKLPPAALKAFNAVQSTSAYPKGALLFMEKQESRGIFMLCEGQVKLSVSSSEGKTLTLRIAKAGEVLGLMAVLARARYEATAETCRPCQVAFVRGDDFLRFVEHHAEAYPGIVRQLIASYDGACEQLRKVGLSASVQERLGRLLLDWSEGSKETKLGNKITVPLTHGEIGELIGTSRESVTRTFTQLRNHHLVVLKGSTLTIPNRAALESFAAH
jgi:CRP/FNR family cyclic AMP-dependent transcriptional regulator